MAIYRLKQHDTEKVKKVLKLFFNRESSPKAQIDSFLSNENNYLLIYENENKLAGFAYGYELQRFDGRKNMMYMHQVEVLPEYRQLGIGKKLMEGFKKICKENKCEKLFLITNKSNLAAIQLYSSVGGVYHHEDDILYTFEI